MAVSSGGAGDEDLVICNRVIVPELHTGNTKEIAMGLFDHAIGDMLIKSLSGDVLKSQIPEVRRRMQEHTPGWNGSDDDCLFLLQMGAELAGKSILHHAKLHP